MKRRMKENNSWQGKRNRRGNIKQMKHHIIQSRGWQGKHNRVGKVYARLTQCLEHPLVIIAVFRIIAALTSWAGHDMTAYVSNNRYKKASWLSLARLFSETKNSLQNLPNF